MVMSLADAFIHAEGFSDVRPQHGSFTATDRFGRVQRARRWINQSAWRQRLSPASWVALGCSQKVVSLSSSRLTGRWAQLPRGAYMMMVTPSRQITAPVMSHRSGSKPSNPIPHSSEPATNTPP
jgi:hypothetical protein